MKHWFVTLLVFVTIFLHLMHFGCASNHRGPNRHKPHLEKNFIGAIYETEDEVIVQPPLLATDEDMPELQGLICGYQLHSLDKKETNIPFYVSLLDKATGQAKVLLKPGMTLAACNNESAYHLLISAVDCGIGIDGDGNPVGQRSSHKSYFDITVSAENKFDPYFVTTNYFVDIEGDITAGQPLLSFKANDNDCSHIYGNICRYEILNDEDGLLEVTSNGLLLSKKQISADKSTMTLNMSVIAYDCGERSSSPASIVININPFCQAQWAGYKENVDFVASEAARVQLFSKPTLDLCIPRYDITSVHLTVSLDMSEVEAITGCDRETYAARDARKLCEGEDQELIDLLPSYPTYKKLSTDFDKKYPKLPQYKRNVAMQGGRVYEFHGIDQALEVDDPDTLAKLNRRNFTSMFSVSFRIFINNNQTLKKKSTIFCKSDSAGLSRHHFSIYLQNRHMMMLIRQEHGKKGKLSPAEWHWKMGNDEKYSERWLQVLFTVNFPNVTLFIDGVKQHPFLIADDYPLHSTSDPPIWTVGAAWEGRKSEYAQYFSGRLSDVVVHLGALEDPNVMKCVGRCKEGLILDGQSPNGSTSQFAFNLHSNGSDLESVTSQLEKVSYVNTRRFPSAGQRGVKVQTKITCTSTANTCPYVPPFRINVDVLPPPDPLITLNGKGVITCAPDEVKGHDLHLFDELLITSGSGPVNDSGSLQSHNLDSCVINEMGTGEKGELEVRPQQLLTRNQLVMERKRRGIAIRGIRPISSYEDTLHGVVYHNSRPGPSEIVFYLYCSELNGRYHSNVYALTVILSEQGEVKLFPASIPNQNTPAPLNTHVQPAPLLAPNRGAGLNLQELDDSGSFEEQLLFAQDQSYSGSSANAGALVIGICVCGMVVLVLIITAHTKLTGCPDQEEEEEVVVKEEICHDMEEGDLDWDDSAMTITVNPMEEEQEDAANASDYDFSEIDEDEVCDRDDRELRRDAREKADDKSYE